LVRGLVVENLGRAPIPSGYADPASRPEVVPEQPADLTREPSNLVLLHLTPSHSEPHGRGDHAVPINQCSNHWELVPPGATFGARPWTNVGFREYRRAPWMAGMGAKPTRRDVAESERPLSGYKPAKRTLRSGRLLGSFW